MKNSLLQMTLAMLFVVLCCIWDWAFLMEPFKEIPFGVRLGLTMAVFGQTSFAAWVVLKRGVWRRAMIAALLISGISTAACLTPYWFEGVEFLHRYPPGPPAKFDLYHVTYLLAPWAVALPWAGLLSLPKLTGWTHQVRQFSIAAIFLLAEIPLEIYLGFCGLGGGPLTWLVVWLLLPLRLGFAVLFVLSCAGVLVVAGPITVWILSMSAGEAVDHPELGTLAAATFRAFRDRPFQWTCRLLFYRMLPLLASTIITLGLCFGAVCFDGGELLEPLRGRHLPATPEYNIGGGSLGYANDGVFYPVVIAVLLILSVAMVRIVQQSTRAKWFAAGIVVGLSIMMVVTIWLYIFNIWVLS